MPTYSHSKLSTFENCPLKFKFRYIDKIELEEEWRSIESFMGKRVHEVLEKLYNNLKTGKLNTLEELLSHYGEIWETKWGDDVRVIKKEYTAEDYKDIGTRCIAGYYNRHKPFDYGRTVAIEHWLMIDVEGYKLKGVIDRLSCMDDGHYEIHDYKTGRYLPNQTHFESDRQLSLYQIGVEEKWEDVKSVDLVWHYLVHGEEIRLKRTEGELEKLKSDIVSSIERIEKAEQENNFPYNESGLCNWCEYQELCPDGPPKIKTLGQQTLD